VGHGTISHFDKFKSLSGDVKHLSWAWNIAADARSL